MSKRNNSIGVECKDGGKVHVAGEHVGTITVGGKPTTVFDDDHTPRNDVEALARELVAKFGIAKARSIAFLAREARVKGESLQQLVERCRAAGIENEDDFTPPPTGEPASADGDAPASTGPHAAVASSGRLTVGGGTQQSLGFDTTHGFLGEEFLTWLWFRWETDGGEFSLSGGRVVGIAIDDLLVFAPLGDDDTKQTLAHGMPTRTAEARQALRGGHRVAKARLLIAEGARQWVATIEGATMRIAAKLPEDAEDCESAEDRNGDRAANWLALHEIVAALFGLFVRARVSEGWQEEAAAMADWMQA